MKKTTIHLLVAAFLLACCCIPLRAGSQGLPPAPDAVADDAAAGFLLRTHWGQRGPFARFSPDNLRLGCWSTAIAQILYYHRLPPSGGVLYETSAGHHIHEDFDAHVFDFDSFVNDFNPNTPDVNRDEVCRYIYYTATVLQKDYGTDSYMLGHVSRAEAISRHYECIAVVYKSTSYGMDRLKYIVRHEIDAQRPLMMHMRNLDHDLYHAVVVDGYQDRDGRLWVHVNMGQNGESDGWFDFEAPILDFDDPGYRKLMTIMPLR